MIQFDKDEELIMKVGKHWFVIFLEGLVIFFEAILPVVLYGIMKLFTDFELNVEIGGNLGSLLSFLYFLWLIILWVYFFMKWTDYYLDVWYVTNKRVIDIDQKGLFRREVITIRYDQVQDITTETIGVLATLLNFGDIQIQSAGTNRAVMLKQATNPDIAKKLIMSFHNQTVEKAKPVKIVSDN